MHLTSYELGGVGPVLVSPKRTVESRVGYVRSIDLRVASPVKLVGVAVLRESAKLPTFLIGLARFDLLTSSNRVVD